MINKPFVFIIPFMVLGLSLLVAKHSTAAMLRVEEVDIPQGTADAIVPISLQSDNGEEVAGVQCDLVFDSNVLSVVAVTTGDAAQAADKSASFSHIASNHIRIIVTGFNLNTIPDGSVANIVFDVADNAEPGAYPIIPQDVLVSDPRGIEVPSSFLQGAVVLGRVDDELGALQVTLQPSGAVNDGARWRIEGGVWQISGTTLGNLIPGEYTVSFREISGWKTPDNQLVEIVAGQSTEYSATYEATMTPGFFGCRGGEEGSVSASAKFLLVLCVVVSIAKKILGSTL